jgi:hypothetical protein
MPRRRVDHEALVLKFTVIGPSSVRCCRPHSAPAVTIAGESGSNDSGGKHRR